MRILVSLSVTLCFAISCSTATEKVNLQKEIKADSSGTQAEILFDKANIMDSPHFIIYPLVLEKSLENDGSDRYETTNYWNLIFYNTETQQQHLLTNRKILITAFTSRKFPNSGAINFEYNQYVNENEIIYNVVADDYNKNDFLDKDDPSYLFMSDKQGNNFRQLSPDSCNVKSWSAINGTSKIILQVQKDNNNDKKFDPSDNIIPMIVDVNSGKVAQPTFNDNYLDSVKNILNITWKANKK